MAKVKPKEKQPKKKQTLGMKILVTTHLPFQMPKLSMVSKTT